MFEGVENRMAEVNKRGRRRRGEERGGGQEENIAYMDVYDGDNESQ